MREANKDLTDKLERSKDEILEEIARKVFGKRINVAREDAQEGKYAITPFKGTEDEQPQELARRLMVQNKLWAFPKRAKNIEKLRPGDYVCIFAAGIGVIAHARIKTKPEYNPNHQKVRNSDEFPWIVQLEDVHFYPDQPVVVKDILSELDMAKVLTNQREWGVLVRGFKFITEHDFKLLTR